MKNRPMFFLLYNHQRTECTIGVLAKGDELFYEPGTATESEYSTKQDLLPDKVRKRHITL